MPGNGRDEPPFDFHLRVAAAFFEDDVHGEGLDFTDQVSSLDNTSLVRLP